MIRKLAFALSLLGASYTGTVNALGLGEVSVKSNLNQPLNAEIELLSASEFSAEEILPGLATREEFLKANVDRVYFHSDISFKVEQNSRGDLVVVLSTKKPVREPFLNFLVEVIWPSGRLLREYALLIDPPLFTEEKVAPVRAVSTRVESAPVQTVSRVQSGDSLSLPVATTSRQSVAQVGNSTLGSSYGPTKSTDTLWDIALKARPDRSVSPQQVMLSILDLNPGAFINQNINKLKAGQVLRLPSIDQIKARTKHQAIEEVIAQNESFKGKRSKSIASAQSAGAAKSTNSAANRSNQADELKLVVASNQQESSVSASAGSARGGTGNASQSDAELALALEKLDKANIEKDELSGRVDDLEEQLQTLQRLLTLKNDQLANIQAQVRANDLEQARVIESAKEKVDESEVSSSVASSAAGSNNEVSELTNESEVVESAGLSGDEGLSANEDPTAKTDTHQSLAKVDVPTSSDEQANPNKKQVATNQEEAKESSDNIIEIILQNPLYLGIAAASVIGIVIILWFVSRNNARREEEFQASIPDDQFEDSAYVDTQSDDVSAEDDDQDQLEDEMEFESESLDAVEDNDIDPEDEDVLAEADVYIAYGRLDQAAVVLENAISNEPVRTDLRLKLLSVYKDSNDKDAFNRQYSELEAIQDAQAIEQANVLRGEFVEDDLLEDELVSIDDTERSLNSDRELEGAADNQLLEEAAIESEAEAINSESQTFDFDSVDDVDELSELDIDESLLESEIDSALTEEDSVEGSVEGPVEIAATDSLEAEIDGIAEELTAELDESDFDDSILDVDLDDIDMSSELDSETEIQLPDNLTEENLAESVEGEAAQEDGGDQTSQDQDLSEEEDFDFLEGTDEASTKLDLARAYIDMGDLEGAKDILEEVVAEGNDEQKSEASELISKLG